ncbi:MULTISPECIES: helix-turn-helix transcriptional regulator [Gordonia]|uniref:Cro/Cl family transcriptional regulator n=3 Tax=Gordonia TaxID=2053 RepID=A0A243Q2W5_9ACTN|nr:MULTISPECIES: helix-turn-helix transcriptional regulator [Gordonia]ETA06173.1 Cro/Cl family transcriptional regulator [Gordonia alkanivorans CGMCC 6845]KSU52706.1 Cro/Cl family transcriptional regulator [Gordonia sp. SGD-V-85]MBM7280639.1 helix-turn-helix transcriptional regulator [Gordonia rubripertincta]MCZ0914065.1 helix-turn-helix transcriptional regulator [Gordonia amicalis]MDH3013110.1 helix-turn-helix transcriptional regulator [Gordonia alkanivorans]
MKQIDYTWHLRARMAAHGMYSTTDLQPHLADRGITLSREQVYRLVTGQPQRLSMHTLVALCDILECTPNDLIEPHIVDTTVRKTAGKPAGVTPITARRTTIRRPGTES